MRQSAIIGIDLSNDFTQVSYVDANGDVASMSTICGEHKYLIPTKILKYSNKFVWCIGDEAETRLEQGSLIENIISSVCEEKTFRSDNIEYSATDVLEIYLKELIKLIKINCKIETIEAAVVTIENLDKKLIDIVVDIMCRQGIKNDNVKVVGHTESFIYYILNQKKDLWVNNAVMFYFNNEYMMYKKLNVFNTKAAYREGSSVKEVYESKVVSVEEKDFSDRVSYKLLNLEGGVELLDKDFTKIVNEEFENTIVSSVFLTGEGFSKSWAKDTLKILCSKRRVFQGTNLIVKGAGFCAREYFDNAVLDKYIFKCTGRTKVNIGLMISHGGREVEQIISYCGENWYEASAYVECILDNVNYIRLNITSPVNGISKAVTMDLSKFPKRPNKTTRVGIDVVYKNENQFTITVTDKGFGEFYKSSGAYVRETVTVSEEM